LKSFSIKILLILIYIIVILLIEIKQYLDARFTYRQAVLVLLITQNIHKYEHWCHVWYYVPRRRKQQHRGAEENGRITDNAGVPKESDQ
jgi:hypothetical protein